MKLRLPSRARTLHLPAETRPRRQALIEMIAGLLELVAALLCHSLMAALTAPPSTIDPSNGYSAATKTYYSLRPPLVLPPSTLPLSTTAYALSLLPSPLPSTPPAFIDASTGAALSYPALLSQIQSLAAALRSDLGLAKGHVALILSPTRLHIPALYFALLSIGAVASPANPASTPDEIAHQIRLTRPRIAFATSASAPKLPHGIPTVILDSPAFQSLLAARSAADSPEVQARRSDPAAALGSARSVAVATSASADKLINSPTTRSLRSAADRAEEVRQSDAAAVLCSSGTTGRVKGVVLSHRNFIALVAGYNASRAEREAPGVGLITVPLFHVFGFFMVVRGVALGQTTVLMERFEMSAMLRAIEKHRVNFMPVSPPLVVAMAKSPEVGRYDLSSLEIVGSGGAPLRKEVAERFTARLPHVKITQGYGLTESTGTASGFGPDDEPVPGSVGRLAASMEARIADVSTGEFLPPGQAGELWIRGPTIMSGYLGDDEATASTLDSEGWLKTGDLCYFDHNGFLFIEDRLKELIKYKAYQVPPAELESILQSHPEIADAAVVPYPHEEAGQIPMAFVVKQPSSTLNEERVMDFVAKQVAPYKKVRRVSFVSSIPKSAAGKILRRELVNQIRTSKL